MADLKIVVTTNKDTVVVYSNIDGSTIANSTATVGSNDILFTGVAAEEFFIVADDAAAVVGDDLPVFVETPEVV